MRIRCLFGHNWRHSISPTNDQVTRRCSRCERSQIFPATQLTAQPPLIDALRDTRNSQLRDAAALVKCIVGGDGEGITVLVTHCDHAELMLHLAALVVDATSQPAAAPLHYLDQAFARLDERQR